MALPNVCTDFYFFFSYCSSLTSALNLQNLLIVRRTHLLPRFLSNGFVAMTKENTTRRDGKKKQTWRYIICLILLTKFHELLNYSLHKIIFKWLLDLPKHSLHFLPPVSGKTWSAFDEIFFPRWKVSSLFDGQQRSPSIVLLLSMIQMQVCLFVRPPYPPSLPCH